MLIKHELQRYVVSDSCLSKEELANCNSNSKVHSMNCGEKAGWKQKIKSCVCSLPNALFYMIFAKLCSIITIMTLGIYSFHYKSKWSFLHFSSTPSPALLPDSSSNNKQTLSGFSFWCENGSDSYINTLSGFAICCFSFCCSSA